MIKVEDEKLFINGNLIPEASEVDKALVFNDLIIVLEGRGTQNVLAFDSFGKKLWRIEPFLYDFRPHGFSNLFDIDGELWAFNMSGFDVKIDPSTGKKIAERWRK